MLTLGLMMTVTAAPKLHVSLVKSAASGSTASVQKELKAQLGPLEGCYDLALKDAPSLKGTVTVSFSVDAELGVTTISATQDSVKDETLVPCVLARLRTGEWPKPKKPLAVTATFRFEQKP